MKYTKLMQLLSVLLCATLLLVSCGNGREGGGVTTEPTQEATTLPEEPTGPVEPVLESYFANSVNEDATAIKAATRLEGEVRSYSGDHSVIVLRNAKVDVMNKVTETFSVYNTREEKVVATFENTYSYGALPIIGASSPFLYDEGTPYQESSLLITVRTAYTYSSSIYYLEVGRATLTEIDEAIQEENEDGCAYYVAISYEYYDVMGQKITESNERLNGNSYWWGVESMKETLISFGDTVARMDVKTGKLLGTQKGLNQGISDAYEIETEKYGYYLGDIDVADGEYRDYLEVYDKSTGARILRHVIEYAYDVEVFVLENGNVLIQSQSYVENDADMTHDYEDEYGRYKLNTYVLNVETGEEKAVKLGFLTDSLMSRETLEELLALYDITLPVSLTKNVQNIAVIQPIEDKLLQYTKIICLDNDLNVVFTMDPIIPEHKINDLFDFGFEILPSGDYLVDLYDVVTPRAIVSSAHKVRSYLKSGDVVVGNFVVNTDGIFDYDGKELYAFDADSARRLEIGFGDHIIVSRTDEPDPTASGAPVKTYCKLTYLNGVFAETVLFENQEIQYSTEDYLVTKDQENGKYTIYNTAMEHVLTTADTVTIYEVSGKFMAVTVVEGETVCYVLK